MTSYLLDTNALLWLGLDDVALRAEVKAAIADAPLFTSAISLAEIAIKASIGKLPLPAPFETDFGGAIRSLLARSIVALLPIDIEAIEHLRRLPLHHRDPFDRMIIAQAFAHGLTVVTSDRAFAAYDGLLLLET